jgi:hypothetical protein
MQTELIATVINYLPTLCVLFKSCSALRLYATLLYAFDGLVAATLCSALATEYAPHAHALTRAAHSSLSDITKSGVSPPR